MANAIRTLTIDAVEKAQSGHPGMPMGMADVATVLFSEWLRYSPADPKWPNRDRFILSAGHGSMLQYALFYLLGYPDISLGDIRQFRQLGAKTAGHPEFGELLGIETTTGPLGQGIANGVGMALAESILHARFGDMVDHRTIVVAGDGCLMEGISHEAASLAGHLKLGKLLVLWDDNHISIDGATDLAVSENTLARFEAYGWTTQQIDGHDHAAIRAALARVGTSDGPHFIACRTIIGYGAPKKAGTAACHGAPLGAEEVAHTKRALQSEGAPFEIPTHVLDSWRAVGKRASGSAAYTQWQAAFQALPGDTRLELERALQSALPDGWNKALQALKQTLWMLGTDAKPEATRKSSGRVLATLVPAIPELVGGSADLTGSNDTLVPGQHAIGPGDYMGKYIHYGVREHAMASIMNGMALHGGVIPYAGTFLVFADYCRPAIRLSALMGQRVIYVMTHDSIGLGEDGPTHQPVEHLAGLRSIPNLAVYRPADAIETLECWELALTTTTAPTLLALTRQNVPPLPRTPPHTRMHYAPEENLCARGGYIVQDVDASLSHQVTLCATGSEVHTALEAARILQAEHHIGTRVLSLPCIERFLAQPHTTQQQLLGTQALRVGVEAAIRFGWDRLLGANDIFIGMDGFGASAPADALYAHFGITSTHIVAKIRERVEPPLT